MSDNPYRSSAVASDAASARSRGKASWLRWGFGLLGVIGLLSLLWPALSTSQGVGHANLELVFQLTDRTTGKPIVGEVLTLEELVEGPVDETKPPQITTLTSDNAGQARHIIKNVMFCSGERFGVEVDYTVDTPWLRMSIESERYQTITPAELPIYLRELHPQPRAEHVGPHRARLVVPVQLQPKR